MNLSIWVCVESNVVILAASIPTLRPIMKRHSGSIEGSSAQRRFGAPSNADSNNPKEGNLQTVRPAKLDPDSPWLEKGAGPRTEQSGQTVSALDTIEDSDSEEYILQPATYNQHIRKTTDVHVEYEYQHDQT